MTKGYEFVFIVNPEADSSKKKNLLSSLKELIKKMGGSVKKEEKWGVKPLAYPIKGKRQGEYFIWQVAIDGSPKLDDLTVFLSREEMVWRYLFLKKATKA
jgi:small subunit ribosomal protein S6